MAASAPARSASGAVLAAVALLLAVGPALAQTLPWEVTVTEIEAGRLRGLAARLSKQNLLYHLHLGDVSKDDIVGTASDIDRILQSLERGSPSYSILAPWTPELREQVARVDRVWGPVRRIAVANPYDYLSVSREFLAPLDRRGDPFLLRYFDELSATFISESEVLLDLYHQECLKTDSGVCPTARTSGYAPMIIERAAKQAVYIVAGIDVVENRQRLTETVAAYQELRRTNDQSPFFADALDPARGSSAAAARELLASLRKDWDIMQGQFAILAAGDEKNFDLRHLLETQAELVVKVDRLTAALIRYASLTYGS
jgi:hypothetical protein